MEINNVEVDKNIKIVFMGTPDFAVPVLQGLIENYKVKAVVTQPDKPVGRKGEIIACPVKREATNNTILVIQPNNLREEWQDVVSLHPDLIITCAYGQIVPRELLVYPKYGCINVHASLLPKLRGGAPIHHAIIDGYKKTGITIMHMSPGLDEGDIISQEELEILDTDTASSLHDKLSIMGRDLLLKTLPSIIDGTATRTPQDNSISTFAKNISKEDERINFDNNRRQVFNQIRGLNAWPGAYCMMDGKRLKVFESYITSNAFTGMHNGQITAIYEDGFGVKVDNGEVVFTVIQPEGKSKMKCSDYLNGIQSRESLIGKILE